MKMMFGFVLVVCAVNAAQASPLRNSLRRIISLRAMLSWRHAPPNAAADARAGIGASETSRIQAVGASGACLSKTVAAAADGKRGGGQIPGLRVWKLARSRSGSNRQTQE